NALCSAVAVLDHHLVGMKVEGGYERARAVRRRERIRLPTARGHAQGSVLELWRGRGQCNSELAEQLRVGVQRVAGGAPVSVRDGRPRGSHALKLPHGRTRELAVDLVDELEVQVEKPPLPDQPAGAGR